MAKIETRTLIQLRTQHLVASMQVLYELTADTPLADDARTAYDAARQAVYSLATLALEADEGKAPF